MHYQNTIQTVRQQLRSSFQALDEQFMLPHELRGYQVADNTWSIDDILEHVTLTSHFLLIVVRTGSAKARKRALTQNITAGESELEPIAVISHPDAFPWSRPEHMEPTRSKTSAEVQATLKQQYEESTGLLDQMSQGEGSLHTVRMSVQNLGKLDMYQWLFFLALHAQRHNVEISRIVTAWHQQSQS